MTQQVGIGIAFALFCMSLGLTSGLHATASAMREFCAILRSLHINVNHIHHKGGTE